MNWFEQIAFQAKLSPDEPAVAFPGGMATYGVLVGCVDAACQHILGAGLKKGQVVALEIRHPLLHLVVILALHRCGIASITLQTSYLIQQANLNIDRLLSDRNQEPGHPSKPVLVGNEWLSAPKGNFSPYPVTGFDLPDDVCRLVLSSGTTGAPKVISVTERNLQYRFARSAALRSGAISVDDGVLDARRLPDADERHGAGRDHLLCRSAGGRAQVIALYHVTHLIAAPFQLRTLLETQTRTGLNLPSLRHVLLAGSRLEIALVAEARAKFVRT